MFRRFATHGWLLAVAVATLATGPLGAQTPERRAQDEAAVRRAGKDYLAALERGDAKAIAEFWTPEGIYVDENGRTVKVRDLLEKKGAAAAKDAIPSQHEISNVTLRFVTPDVAIEEGSCETTLADNPTPAPGCYSAMWVRQNGKWKLDSLRETRSETRPNAELLASLEPFVGQWSGEAGGLTLRASAKWNSGKTFLRRDFSASADGKELFSGTQEIGYDPVSQTIKSWSFNADGSHGEGIWSLEGNVWVELGTKVLPDGKIFSATQTFKFSDKNTLVWKLMTRDSEGQLVPTFEIKFARKTAN
jgi:uncharacterized protein (TIGR02246 family)